MKSSTRLQRPLRTEQPLDVDAAQADGVDAAAMALRPDVAHQVGGARRVAVDVTIEASHALHAEGRFGFAVGGGVELLLRELRHQQPQPLQILGVEDAGKQLLEIIDRHHLALRDVAQVGARGQENGRRELGQKMVGQVEVDVEPGQAGELLDLGLGEDHAADQLLGMGQGQKALGKKSLVANRHRSTCRPVFPTSSLRADGPSGRPESVCRATW